MPPKKGGKGKGKGGAGIIDGVDTTQMTREQLEIFALRIKEENEREREERNFFQLERDKLRTFWEITRNELEETRAKLRNKDRQIEEAAEANEEELKFFKQKVKHLQYEHQNNLTECKAEAMTSLKLALDDHTEQERELLRDKRELKGLSREKEMANLEQIKALKLQFSEELHNARADFMEQVKELENKYEKRFNNLMQDLGIKHQMEMSEVEERKNKQITDMQKNHEDAFNEMKNYYNDITLNNLALISSLKDQMEVLRNQNERMSKQVADLTAENKNLAEPLRQALADVTEFKRQLQNYEKDKLSLANTKAKLVATRKELADLRWANEALELRFERAIAVKQNTDNVVQDARRHAFVYDFNRTHHIWDPERVLQAERDELHSRFVKAVLEVQQKTGFKNALLQKRVQTLTEMAQAREAVIGEISAATQVPPGLNDKFEKILSKKNQVIKELRYELARVCKAHDDLLDTYEEKLAHYGIPKNELGFTPLRALPEGQAGLAKGPAGLVTKNP